MTRTVKRQMKSIVTFQTDKVKSDAPRPPLLTLPMDTPCNKVPSPPTLHLERPTWASSSFASLSISSPFVVTPYMNPTVYEPVSPIQRITEHYKHYVANSNDEQSTHQAKHPNDLLGNIQLQMMYVVDSQRGSPALFVVKGWMTDDNSRWFDCIVRNDSSLSNRIDLTKNVYQEIPQFDVVLQRYNTLVREYATSSNDDPVIIEGRKMQWKPPTEMKWAMVGIENHTLVIWVGPHRVISQPGHTTHIYMNPKPREMLIEEMQKHPPMRTMMETIRLRLGSTASEHDLFPLPTDTVSNHVTRPQPVDYDHAHDAIRALRERSWAAIHYRRDAKLSREFFETTAQDANTYFAKTTSVSNCCARVQPIVFAIWETLYDGLSEQSIQYVSFPPTEYTQYKDDDTSPFFPPHIDYRAVF